MLEGLLIGNTARFLHRSTDTSTPGDGPSLRFIDLRRPAAERSTVPPTTGQTICASAGCSAARSCAAASRERSQTGPFLRPRHLKAFCICGDLCRPAHSAARVWIDGARRVGSNTGFFLCCSRPRIPSILHPHFHARTRAHTHTHTPSSSSYPPPLLVPAHRVRE